jgi:predicted permease
LAVVLVLLASAGLLLESFRRLIVQDLGYAPQSVVAIDLSTNGFPDNAAVARWYRDLHARLKALPGVQAVGTISSAPLTGKWTFEEKMQVVGRPVPEADRPSVGGTFVAFDYFEAMGIPVVEGRVFRAADLRDDQVGRHVILNEAAARSVFASRSAIGEHVTLGAQTHRVLEVIGVVKDTRDVRLDEKPQPRFYLHYPFGGAQVVVRSAVPARTMVPVLRAAVQGDRRVILRDIRPMAEIVSGTLAERRFLMAMLGTYAALALAIAAVGIFGVVACQVAQRRKEFGVRLALGASPRAVASLVVLQAVRLAASGLAIGLVAAAAANRLVASQVFDVSPHDPVLLLAASATLLSVAVLAALLPAWRAAHVDPMEPLRGE